MTEPGLNANSSLFQEDLTNLQTKQSIADVSVYDKSENSAYGGAQGARCTAILLSGITAQRCQRLQDPANPQDGIQDQTNFIHNPYEYIANLANDGTSVTTQTLTLTQQLANQILASFKVSD